MMGTEKGRLNLMRVPPEGNFSIYKDSLGWPWGPVGVPVDDNEETCVAADCTRRERFHKIRKGCIGSIRIYRVLTEMPEFCPAQGIYIMRDNKELRMRFFISPLGGAVFPKYYKQAGESSCAEIEM